MNKLSTLLAIVAMAVGLGVTGCPKKKADQHDEPAAKTTEKNGGEMPKPEDKTAEANPEDKMAAPASELPPACGEYRTAIEKLGSCDKVPPATRDALKQTYDRTSAAWANIPAQSKAALGTACKSAADSVKQSAASACGW